MRFQSAGEMYEQLLKIQKNPYVSFLAEYEEASVPKFKEDITEEQNFEDDTTLSKQGGAVIEEYGIAEEKNEMVRNVVFQTLTYLVAVIVSVLLMVFIISRYNSVKDNFKNYDVVMYKTENYIGKPATAVKEALEANGIKVEQELVENEEYPAGYVVAQSVDTDKLLEANDKVVLSVAAKEGSFIVDDYSGESFQPVGTELMTQDISVEYKQLYSAKYSDGKIIRTSPGPGSILQKGDKIVIYYSSGPLYRTVTVPRLIGLTLEEARQELSRINVGLNVGIIYPSPSQEIDHLLPATPTSDVTISPTTGTTELPTGEVALSPSVTPTGTPELSPSPDDTGATLLTNTGTPEPTSTPDVTGTPEPTLTPAVSQTPDVSVTPTTQPTQGPTYAFDKVVSQYPAAGSQLMVNEKVNLYFYDIDMVRPQKTMTFDFPTETVVPVEGAEPVQIPAVTGNSCAVRIEAVMADSSQTAAIVYMQAAVEKDKFPIEYNVPLSLNNAPTKVYIYIGEVGGSMKLYKVINVYG